MDFWLFSIIYHLGGLCCGQSDLGQNLGYKLGSGVNYQKGFTLYA